MRVIVLPNTSNVDSLYPGEALVEVKGKPGRAVGDQIRSIDKSRLGARVGRLIVDEMSRIDVESATPSSWTRCARRSCTSKSTHFVR